MNVYLFIIVGVGGTGSLLARDLAKLLIDTPHKLLLIDGDKVEEKNMKRQSYQRQDVGLNKALALSAKINSLYSNDCYYYDKYLTKDELKVLLNEQYKYYVPVIIGCVDNDKTRKILEDTFLSIDDSKAYYFDSANSEYDGNVYVASKDNVFIRSYVYEFQEDIHPLEKSCQELQAYNLQYLITNAKMAMCLLEHCQALLYGNLKEGVSVIGRLTQVHYSRSN